MAVFISGTTYPPKYGKDVFSDNSWGTIIKACQMNAVPSTWQVGDQKAMTINGTEYLIDIIGKNHDVYADGTGAAPLTFQLHDLYETTHAMNSQITNAGGWAECAMRNTHLPAILALMPAEVQAGIREVNKLTSAGNQSAVINTTADKLFLLSRIENSDMSWYQGEGRLYEYYIQSEKRIKTLSGAATTWWTRSPYTNTTNFGFNYPDGRSNSGNANLSYGVAFAFCF